MSPPSPRHESRRVANVTQLLGAALAACGLWHLRAFFHDDAFITLRYARRLLAGRGLTWNDGEHVEGFTNLLWLLQSAALGALGIDLQLATRCLGVAYLAALWGLWRAAGLWSLPLLLVATNTGTLLWSLGGLETVSFAFWLASGALGIVRAHERIEAADVRGADVAATLAGVAFGAAALTRPEGLACGFVALVWLATARRRTPLARAAGAMLLPVLAYMAFRVVYYGDVVPNPARVKVDGQPIITQAVSAWAYLMRARERWAPAIAASALVVAWTRSRRGAAVMALSAPVWLSLLLGGGDHMPGARLVVPAVVLCAVAAGVAGAPREHRARAVVSVALSLVAVWQASRVLDWNISLDPAAAVGAPIGRFLEARLPPGSLVATATAGSTPYHAPSLRFIDTLGLNDRVIARRETGPLVTRWQHMPGHRKGDGAYVLRRAPDVVILGPAHGELGADPTRWFLTDYELLGSAAFRARYRPFGLRVPVTEEERAWPFVRALLDPATSTLPLTVYVRVGSRAALRLVTDAVLLTPPWDDAPSSADGHP